MYYGLLPYSRNLNRYLYNLFLILKTELNYECRHGNFWIGLGIGSILGAVAYRLSRTAKAKQLESEIYNAIHRIGRDAEIAAAHAERKAMDLGLKAVETGAEIADKVAAEADKVAGKAKDKWEK